MTETKRDLTKERNDRCAPIAKELLKRLGAHDDLMIGEFSEGDQAVIDWYGDFYVKEIIPLFMEKDLTIDDCHYVFRLMQQATMFAQGRSDLTIDMAFEQASSKLWNVDSASDVRLSQVEAVLVKQKEESVDNSLPTETKEE